MQNPHIDQKTLGASPPKVPVIQVSHLPSASSFYAAVSQPLGIQYLSSTPAAPLLPSSSSSSPLKPLVSPSSSAPVPAPLLPPASSSACCIAFGCVDPHKPLFELWQVAATPEQPLRRCHLTLAVSSLDAVNNFHAAALKANPRSKAVVGTRAGLAHSSSVHPSVTGLVSGPADSGEVSARVTDFDGSTMEVAYLPAPNYSSLARQRPFVDFDSSSPLVGWSYDMPSSQLAHSYSPRSGSRYRDIASGRDASHYYYEAPSRRSEPRRSSTAATSANVYDMAPAYHSPRQNSKGVTVGGMTSVLAGTIAGVAAGAAFTYTVMRSTDRPRTSSYNRNFEDAMAIPALPRRSTFPDQYPSYTATGGGGGGGGYDSRDSMRSRSRKDVREVEDLYEADPGRRYRPSGSGSGSSVRTRSEAGLGRVPLMLADCDYRSGSGSGTDPQAAPVLRSGGSSARSRHLSPPSLRRSATYDYHGSSGEHDSYVSAARSHRTNGSRLPQTPPSASRSASIRHSASRSSSYVTAHMAPLPRSGAGSSNARWESLADQADDDDDYRNILGDNDGDSIAPSDSISCVGSHGRDRRYR